MADPNKTRLARLVELVAANTAARKLEWARGAAAPLDAWQTTLGANRIWIGRTEDGGVALRLFGADGSPLDAVSAAQLAGAPTSDGSDWPTLMNGIMERAAKQASGVDQIVDDLIEQLSRNLS